MAEPTVVVGLITKAHGLQGEVAVQSRSDNPGRWIVGSVVFDEDGRSFTVASARGSGARLLVRFDEIDDRTAAEHLRGTLLVVPRSWLPDLPDGEYWPHQLQACTVVTTSGRELGRLRDVIASPAHDLWSVVDDAGVETLVPAIREVVDGVDIEAGRIVVRDVPGLTAPDEPGSVHPDES